MKRLLMMLAAVLFASHSWAVIPENGWWWNASESGRGFNIEVQNNQLFLASFGYDLNGAPMWIFSGGPMSSDRDYNGELFRSTFGQCFGCPYVTPIFLSIGTVNLHFTSSQTAILTVNGFAVAVKRFNFWLNETAPDAMLGEWSAVIGATGDIFDGERIDYNARLVGSTGVPFVAGYRLGSTPSLNGAVVQYNATQGVWSALLDSSSSFYRFFVFNTTGFNRVEGSFWVYLKTSSPAGSGTFYQAFRTASAALIQTGVGPGSTKDFIDAEQLQRSNEDRDLRLYERLSRTSKAAASPEVLQMARELEERLQSMRRQTSPD